MSAYHEYETIFTDRECLVKALHDLGYVPKVFEKPQSLEGYEGRKRPEKAEVIVPRRQVGSAANDIGFQRQADGTFKAIISEYDRQRYNKAWEQKLKQKYQEHNAVKLAAKQGAKLVKRSVVKTKSGERVQLVFAKSKSM